MKLLYNSNRQTRPQRAKHQEKGNGVFQIEGELSKLVEKQKLRDIKGAKQYGGADTRVQGQKVDKSIEGVCKTCPKQKGFCKGFARLFEGGRGGGTQGALQGVAMSRDIAKDLGHLVWYGFVLGGMISHEMAALRGPCLIFALRVFRGISWFCCSSGRGLFCMACICVTFFVCCFVPLPIEQVLFRNPKLPGKNTTYGIFWASRFTVHLVCTMLIVVHFVGAVFCFFFLGGGGLACGLIFVLLLSRLGSSPNGFVGGLAGNMVCFMAFLS